MYGMHLLCCTYQTAKLRVENLAQTTFSFSTITYPDPGLRENKIDEGQSIVDYLIVILSSTDGMNEANVVKGKISRRAKKQIRPTLYGSEGMCLRVCFGSFGIRYFSKT